MPVLDPELVPALIRAVEEGGLQLHFQPEIDLASGAVVGMEALLRWAHPARGLLWPGQFLDAARAAGLQDRIGSWVLRQCAVAAARWPRQSPADGRGGLQLRVNLSAWTFAASAGFVSDACSLVGSYGLPPAMLALEFDGSALAYLDHELPGVLSVLRTTGVAIAISDTRAWRTTLATGAGPPIDIVKVNRVAVRDLGMAVAGGGSGLELSGPPRQVRNGLASGTAWTSVAASIAMAHERGLLVVAEGVESWTESAALCELGCDRAHGLLFCGPQRADRALSLLTSGTGWRRTL